MSKFVKTAIAAAMVMGAFTSTATIAAGNNGTVILPSNSGHAAK